MSLRHTFYIVGPLLVYSVHPSRSEGQYKLCYALEECKTVEINNGNKNNEIVVQECHDLGEATKLLQDGIWPVLDENCKDVPYRYLKDVINELNKGVNTKRKRTKNATTTASTTSTVNTTTTLNKKAKTTVHTTNNTATTIAPGGGSAVTDKKHATASTVVVEAWKPPLQALYNKSIQFICDYLATQPTTFIVGKSTQKYHYRCGIWWNPNPVVHCASVASSTSTTTQLPTLIEMKWFWFVEESKGGGKSHLHVRYYNEAATFMTQLDCHANIITDLKVLNSFSSNDHCLYAAASMFDYLSGRMQLLSHTGNHSSGVIIKNICIWTSGQDAFFQYLSTEKTPLASSTSSISSTSLTSQTDSINKSSNTYRPPSITSALLYYYYLQLSCFYKLRINHQVFSNADFVLPWGSHMREYGNLYTMHKDIMVTSHVVDNFHNYYQLYNDGWSCFMSYCDDPSPLSKIIPRHHHGRNATYYFSLRPKILTFATTVVPSSLVVTNNNNDDSNKVEKIMTPPANNHVSYVIEIYLVKMETNQESLHPLTQFSTTMAPKKFLDKAGREEKSRRRMKLEYKDVKMRMVTHIVSWLRNLFAFPYQRLSLELLTLSSWTAETKKRREEGLGVGSIMGSPPPSIFEMMKPTIIRPFHYKKQLDNDMVDYPFESKESGLFHGNQYGDIDRISKNDVEVEELIRKWLFSPPNERVTLNSPYLLHQTNQRYGIRWMK